MKPNRFRIPLVGISIGYRYGFTKQECSLITNHFTELVVPFAYFAPSPISALAGLITLFFQSWLFASGNFSFLGFLTMVLALSTFNDSWLKHVIRIHPPALVPRSPFYLSVTSGLTVLVAALSFYPISNMISQGQIMNASFEPFHLVNTYGAFGTITRPRYEVIVEGTDEPVLTGLPAGANMNLSESLEM